MASSSCIPLAAQGDFSIMWKTVSEDCNLACDYCYYSSCAGRPDKVVKVIEDGLLETFISKYMARANGNVSFAWQGGEPLLAGLAFFRRAVELQASYAKPNTVIGNALQTNGTLITAEWARFLREYRFLVGVSLDGPAHIHDARRVYSNGTGSFSRVMAGITQLQLQRVDFNILTVVHEGNVGKAKEMIAFYREQRFSYIQFIPAMDFRAQNPRQEPRFLITPEQYGLFLCELFDEWYNDGRPVFSERFFDQLLSQYLGRASGLCIHQQTCPRTLILEQNGDAYPCDFYLDEAYKLGNVGEDSLDDILSHPTYSQFLALKPELPEACRSCSYLDLCHGGCPRNRGQYIGETEPHRDYFCQSYKMIYAYSKERMEELAASVRGNWLANHRKRGLPLPGRNEPCFCGSGKKYKICCESFA